MLYYFLCTFIYLFIIYEKLIYAFLFHLCINERGYVYMYVINISYVINIYIVYIYINIYLCRINILLLLSLLLFIIIIIIIQASLCVYHKYFTCAIIAE
jgi:hypothetical protein